MENNTNNKDILLVNKPLNWTSNDVVQKVKKLIKAKKVGHCGTLDPLASGLLILGVNEGTKLMNNLILNDKEYLAEIEFGYATSTYDKEGKVVGVSDYTPTLEKITSILEQLKKGYLQTVPAYSAVKINGKKLCDLARKNTEITLPKKQVKLISYNILSFKDKIITIELKVSKGFYVRSLAFDLGELSNSKATLIGLKRTKIGNYSLDNALEIEDIYDYWFKH